MKDLRDLMNVIEEGQNALDETHPYFDGVWNNFEKIKTIAGPDAVALPSADMIKHEQKRRRAISANLAKEQKEVMNEVNVYDDSTFVDLTGNL